MNVPKGYERRAQVTQKMESFFTKRNAATQSHTLQQNNKTFWQIYKEKHKNSPNRTEILQPRRWTVERTLSRVYWRRHRKLKSQHRLCSVWEAQADLYERAQMNVSAWVRIKLWGFSILARVLGLIKSVNEDTRIWKGWSYVVRLITHVQICD